MNRSGRELVNGYAPEPKANRLAPDGLLNEGAWGAFAFVWGIWAGMLLSLVGFVGYYSHNVPYADDWALVPYVAGAAPVTAASLWEQHNEHRLPLPKLALLALARLSGGDFRAGMYASAALLGALAFLLIRTAQHLRGRLTFSDALLPLLLLNWGHVETFLWNWQVQISLAALLVGVVFVLLIGNGSALTARQAFGFWLCLILLTLCGIQGIPVALALALWLGYVGVRRCLTPRPSYQGAVILVLAVTVPVLIGTYFLGYRRNPGSYTNVAAPAVKAVVRTGLEALSMSLGPAVRHDFPKEIFKPYSWLVVPAALILSGVLAAAVWARRPAERTRALGVLLFLVALGGLVGMVGRARAGDILERGQGYDLRQTLIMAPSLYSVYLIWTLYARSASGRLVRMTLFTLVCSLSVFNMAEGMAWAEQRSRSEVALIRDLEAGEPVHRLARRYSRPLAVELDQEAVADGLRLLHAAKIRPYDQLRDDPPFREVPLPAVAVRSQGMTRGAGKWESRGGNAYLDFALPSPQLVGGVRLKITYLHRDHASSDPLNENSYRRLVLPWTQKEQLLDGSRPRLQVSWKTAGQKDFQDVDWFRPAEPCWQEERYLDPGPEEQTVTVWVDDVIDRLRVFPDRPIQVLDEDGKPTRPARNSACAFVISEITLLIPPARPDDEPPIG